MVSLDAGMLHSLYISKDAWTCVVDVVLHTAAVSSMFKFVTSL